MSEPLHLQPDPEPQIEQVRIGDATLELDPEAARVVRGSYEALAAQYQARLEEMQRQLLSSVGTPQGQRYAEQYAPAPPAPLVPDPDLLFQNKQAWTDEFGNAIQGQIGQVRQENLQTAQGLAQAFQNELARRDAQQEAKRLHDSAMAEMLERRGLTENQLVVQAVYNREFARLRELPLEMALDKIGAQAQEEIARIRSGENWQLGPANTQTGLAPQPPRMLRSARRAQRAPAPQSAPAEQELQSPGGGLGMMGQIIRKRQAALMGGSAA